MINVRTLDLAGIGVGPFNLSLAALLAPVSSIAARFYERRPSFSWHPGMMLPGSRMQTSFLKDLVTPVDPSSRYSFLSYIVQNGRFYRFVNAEFSRVRRVEFADYLRWVASQLPNVQFGSDVVGVAPTDAGFELQFASGAPVLAKHLAVATGLVPYVPSWAREHLSGRCFHTHGYQNSELGVEGKRVLVIGGGQSGAEVLLQLLSGVRGTAAEVTWVSRRPGLDPLDETAFTNEYFTPDYVKHFHRLPEERRRAIAYSQKLTGDGVSPETLRDLSQYLYEHDFLRPLESKYRIMTNREVRSMARRGAAFELTMRNAFNQVDESLSAEIVIFATGYRYSLPGCLHSLSERLETDKEGHLRLEEDYTARWDGPREHKIYMINAGRHSHGIPDSQLSLTAWRSAVIINSLCDREVYAVEPCAAPLEWVDTRTPQSQRGGRSLPMRIQLG